MRLRIDSSAALSLISRIGLGKATQTEIQHLCLQQAVRIGRVLGEKALTDVHVADIVNKHLRAERVSISMALMNCFFWFSVSALTARTSWDY